MAGGQKTTIRTVAPRGGPAVERVPIRIPKTAELVADSIRKQILGGELKEGDTLHNEAQIIEDFAVSRPTVREAFRILESEKLISVSRGSRGGARVHVPKAEQVARYAGFVLQSKGVNYHDVYAARTLIEPPAAGVVADTRWKDGPEILREVIAQQRARHGDGEFGRAVAEFHTKLIELTGNQTLILVSRMLDGIVARYQAGIVRAQRQDDAQRRRSEVGLRSQEKLVALIEARDSAGAVEHWRNHMTNAAKAWLAHPDAESVVEWRD